MPPHNYLWQREDGIYVFVNGDWKKSKAFDNNDEEGNNEQEESEITISQAWKKTLFDYNNQHCPVKTSKVCVGVPFSIGSSNEYYEKTNDVGDIRLDYFGEAPYELHIQTQEDPRIFNIDEIPEDLYTNDEYSTRIIFLYDLDELNAKATDIQQLDYYAPYDYIDLYKTEGSLSITQRTPYATTEQNVMQLLDGKYYVWVYGWGD